MGRKMTGRDLSKIQMVEPLSSTDIYHYAHPLHHLTLDEQEEWEEAYVSATPKQREELSDGHLFYEAFLFSLLVVGIILWIAWYVGPCRYLACIGET